MKRIFLIASIVLGVGTASAQSGLIPATQSEFLITDMLGYSQNQYSFGTARSAAMGGAFTSLGADLQSMSVNPAGLGMYTKSEITFTPSMVFSKDKYPNAPFSEMTNRSQFSIGNFGMAIKAYENSRTALTNVTIGFGYNKLADYNYRGAVGLNDNLFSIGDVFMSQLNNYYGENRGIEQKYITRSSYPFENTSISPSMWGAILGYSRSFLEPEFLDDDNNTNYSIGPRVADGTMISHYALVDSKGSAGEYDFSIGMNFQNKLYFGLTLAIQDIYNKRYVLYEEGFNGNTDDNKHIDYLQFEQWQKNTGTSTSAKIGIIYRPMENLRFGFAFHTPAYTTIRREYSAGMFTQYLGTDGAHGYADTPVTGYDYKYTSAPKVLFGASYTMGNIGIITADYERTWYNGMRLKSGSASFDETYKNNIKREYKASNNFRAGLELRVTPSLYLRGGYALYGSMLKDNEAMFSSPIAYRTQIYSGGLGYRSNKVSIDLAYGHGKTDFTKYDLFILDDIVNSGDPIDLKRNLDNLTLTLAFRF